MFNIFTKKKETKPEKKETKEIEIKVEDDYMFGDQLFGHPSMKIIEENLKIKD